MQVSEGNVLLRALLTTNRAKGNPPPNTPMRALESDSSPRVSGGAQVGTKVNYSRVTVFDDVSLVGLIVTMVSFNEMSYLSFSFLIRSTSKMTSIGR